MPLPYEEYESLITELNNPELEHTRRVEILSDLRNDYTAVHADFTNLTSTNEKLKSEKYDLLEANSQLFRKAGFNTEDKKKEEAVKERSETITLEELIGG